jgi:hypothetical protein
VDNNAVMKAFLRELNKRRVTRVAGMDAPLVAIR